MTKSKTTATISAENTFSDPIKVARGYLLGLSGTWVATVTMQLSFDNSTWLDITDENGTAIAITSNGTYLGNLVDYEVYVRWGVKTGNYTSGSAVGNLVG
ncbi:MAG: hypothetical protein MI867_12370 [Pseudomonadales bacterium]|nr:hypothetical protein [Pseudomonadales bacterium]